MDCLLHESPPGPGIEPALDPQTGIKPGTLSPWADPEANQLGHSSFPAEVTVAGSASRSDAPRHTAPAGRRTRARPAARPGRALPTRSCPLGTRVPVRTAHAWPEHCFCFLRAAFVYSLDSHRVPPPCRAGPGAGGGACVPGVRGCSGRPCFPVCPLHLPRQPGALPRGRGCFLPRLQPPGGGG